MTAIRIHKRLNNARDEAIRRPAYRPVYSHMLLIAHMAGHLIADDHPSWGVIETAILAARAGDTDAIDIIERELSRLRHQAKAAPQSLRDAK